MNNRAENIETPEPTIYRIESYRMSDVEKRVAKFNKRAERYGFAPVSIEIVREEIVEVEDHDPRTGKLVKTGEVRIFKHVVARGECPKVAGFELVARVEHTEAGNVISKAPDAYELDLEEYRTADAKLCDHCGTRRNRIDTFVVRDVANGTFCRVGRNCLADYVRSEKADEALRLWTFLRDLDGMCGGDGCGAGGERFVTVEHFVACVAREIERRGWVSGRVAYEQDRTSTKTNASFAAFPCFSRDQRTRDDWREGQPSDENRETARAAIDWAKGNPETSDFAENLRVVCSLEYLGRKNMGIAAASVICHKIARERADETARREREAGEARKVSEHFGEVGHRYARKLTVTKTREISGDYGLTTLVVLVDADGNRFKWFASGTPTRPASDDALEAGDEFVFAFAVKGHDTYEGVKQTQITRAGAMGTDPAGAFKWFDPATGEVFKTKKALKAAQGAA